MTRKRAIIMEVMIAVFTLPFALAVAPGSGRVVATLVIGLMIALAVPGVWLATMGIRLDHEHAHKGLWWSIWVHSLGFTASAVVVLLVIIIARPVARSGWPR